MNKLGLCWSSKPVLFAREASEGKKARETKLLLSRTRVGLACCFCHYLDKVGRDEKRESNFCDTLRISMQQRWKVVAAIHNGSTRPLHGLTSKSNKPHKLREVEEKVCIYLYECDTRDFVRA